MRTVNISYLYLEGDTEGRANSNRVRCTTPTHSFNCLANGEIVQEAMWLTAPDIRNPLILTFANRTWFLKRQAMLALWKLEIECKDNNKSEVTLA